MIEELNPPSDEQAVTPTPQVEPVKPVKRKPVKRTAKTKAPKPQTAVKKRPGKQDKPETSLPGDKTIKKIEKATRKLEKDINKESLLEKALTKAKNDSEKIVRKIKEAKTWEVGVNERGELKDRLKELSKKIKKGKKKLKLIREKLEKRNKKIRRLTKKA